jgi:hypothetical protein
MKRESKVRAAVGTLCVLLVADIVTAQQRSSVDVPEEIVRQLIAGGVRPESLRLRSDGTPDGLSATSVNLEKNGARGLVVAGTSLGELCGATGNCAHWLFARAGNQYRLPLDANSIQHLEVLRTSHQGRRDILTTRHDSAFDYTLFKSLTSPCSLTAAAADE